MKKITEKVSNQIQFPLEVISTTPKIEITGNKLIYIENHKGIKMFTSETIEIKLTKGLFIVEGKKISILEINKEHIYITGIFNSFRFDKILEWFI